MPMPGDVEQLGFISYCVGCKMISVQFSCSVVSDFLWPHGLHHARLPCLLPNPGAYSNSCPWCHPTISSSAAPFSFYLQSFSASGSFPVSRLKYQSFSFSISPSNEYSGLFSFRIDWLISLQSKGFSRVFSSTTVSKHRFFCTQPSLWRLTAEDLMFLNCGGGEDSWESLGLQGDQTSQS